MAVMEHDDPRIKRPGVLQQQLVSIRRLGKEWFPFPKDYRINEDVILID
jgi:hypothetical protein